MSLSRKQPFRSTRPVDASQPPEKLLPRLTLFFFRKPTFIGLLWLSLLVFGIVSYTTLLRREGFPSVVVPIAVVNGTYAAGDPGKIDAQVARPIADIAHQQTTVKTVTSQSAGNFFNVVVQYKDGVDARAATDQT